MSACEQCGGHAARFTTMGQATCALCREIMLGTFDDGRDVGQDEIARMLRYFETWEAAELMAFLTGAPRLFSPTHQAPSITRAAPIPVQEDTR